MFFNSKTDDISYSLLTMKKLSKMFLSTVTYGCSARDRERVNYFKLPLMNINEHSFGACTKYVHVLTRDIISQRVDCNTNLEYNI